MKPGQLFSVRTGAKTWRRVIDADGVVHDGKPLWEAQWGAKAKRTNFYQARCDQTLQLYLRSDEAMTCLTCIAMKGG